ncbi:MAG: DUF563 domain-containing protein [Ruminococcus sp.]|nr:DUF563 domain-containing protein [Candidatus Apopatosoma intestinale]
MKESAPNGLEQYLTEHGEIRYAISGKSMMPLLDETKNDSVLIRALRPAEGDAAPEVGDVVLYRQGDRYILHRIIGVSGDGENKIYRLRGDNNFQSEEVYPEQILGIMTAFFRGDRRTDTTDRSYRRTVRRILAVSPEKQRQSAGNRRYRDRVRRFLGQKDHHLFTGGQYLFNTPSSLMILEQLSHSHKIEKEPYVLKIDNGIVLPRKSVGGFSAKNLGGVLTESHEFVRESREYDFGGGYDVREEEIETRDEAVIYLGRSFPHYGVVMIDTVRRLYYRYTEEGKGLKLCVCGIYCEPGTFGRADSRSWELLSEMGVRREDVIDVRTPTRFQRVYVPEPGFEYDKWVRDEFYLPYKAVFDKAEAKGPKKIYLSRKKMGTTKEAGEAFIEKFFRLNGFESIYPDELSIPEQVEMLKGADVIASVEGTVSHNILFCKPGTAQIIIRRHTRLEPRHFLFNELMDSPVTYIDCYFHFLPGFPRHYDIGPFCMLFNKNIRQFAKDNGYRVPSGRFFSNLVTVLTYCRLCAGQKKREKAAAKAEKRRQSEEHHGSGTV